MRSCLGEGAYGKVYEGVENKTQMKVAIKKLDIRQFERDPYLRSQIISEIDILKKFNHRNIVKFIDHINTQRSLYIITEFCQHGDLRQLVSNKRLNEE
jgi:calcium-dependent protein kinase